MTETIGFADCDQSTACFILQANSGESYAPQDGAEIKGHGEAETLQEYADLVEPSAAEKTARLLISEREKLLSSNLWKNFGGGYIVHHYLKWRSKL